MNTWKKPRCPKTCPSLNVLIEFKISMMHYNFYIKDGKKMRKKDLIMKDLTKNPPQYLVKDFIMKEGNTFKTIKEARKLLNQIKKAYYMSKKFKTSNKKETNQTNSKEDGTKENPTGNRYWLPGHNHPWKESPNNPKSTNFNGTHFKRLKVQTVTMQLRRTVVIRIPMRSPVIVKLSMSPRKKISKQVLRIMKASVLNIEIFPTRNTTTMEA